MRNQEYYAAHIHHTFALFSVCVVAHVGYVLV